MNVLLDACALMALSRGELPSTAADALRTAPEANVSVVSAWEIAIKAARHKLRLGEPPRQWFQGVVQRYDLREIPLDSRIACQAAALPPLHSDPFDRVIVALAQDLGLAVLTSDENIAKYPGLKTLW
jgi:PIN domain nuclease of toxin-antitoxin system